MWAVIKNDTRLVPALLTAAIGMWLCWQGLQMPRPRGWSSSPGLFPLIIGASLVLMAVALLLERRRLLRYAAAERKVSQSNISVLEAKMELAAAEPQMAWDAKLRTALVTALIVLYVVGLSYLNFEIASFCFLVAAMLAFGERSLLRVLSVSAAGVLLIAIVFIYVLETLLPGKGSLIETIFFG